MRDISGLDTYADVNEWCRDFFTATDAYLPSGAYLHGLYGSERLLLMALVHLLLDYFSPRDLSLDSLLTLLSMAEAREGDPYYKCPLDILFDQIETGKNLIPDKDDEGNLKWVHKPSRLTRRDGVKPADTGGFSPNGADPALQCWYPLKSIPRADFALIVSDLTCRAIDFKCEQQRIPCEPVEDPEQTDADGKRTGLSGILGGRPGRRKER